MNYYEVKAVSASQLKRYAHLGFLPKQEEETPAMSIGKGIHSLLLENKNPFFACDARTKEGKEILALNKDGIRVQESFLARIPDLQASFKEALSYVNSGRGELAFEQEFFSSLYDKGIPCKAKIDILGEGIIIDLKTISSFDSLPYKKKEYKYQLGWYSLVYALSLGRPVEASIEKVIIAIHIETCEFVIIRVEVTPDDFGYLISLAEEVWHLMNTENKCHEIFF